MSTQRTVHQEEESAPPTRRTSNDGRSAAATIGAAVPELVPELKVKLRQLVKTGKNRVTEWNDGIQGGIREKPIQSILIAAAVGAVIGLIVGRRSA